MTKTGAIIGTPQYMSPEQARGREIDGRSDLYALGIVFYEMLTGDAPYKGADSITVGIKHITEPVPVLPDDLIYAQGILNLFLAKNPDERYQSGMDAYKDLKILQKRMNLDSGVFMAAGQEETGTSTDASRAHERAPFTRGPGRNGCHGHTHRVTWPVTAT